MGNLCGVCSDGAPSMLGAKSGLHTLLRNLSTKVITIHCMIHRQALASKTLFFCRIYSPFTRKRRFAMFWTVSPHSLGSCYFRVTCLPHKGGASR